VVWKHLVAQAYWDILDTLRADGAAIVDYDALRHAFLKRSTASTTSKRSADRLTRSRSS